MDGKHGSLALASSPRCIDCCTRWNCLDGRCPSNPRYVLLTESRDAPSLLTAVPVLIQKLASDINKSRRAFNHCSASIVDDVQQYIVGDQLQEAFRRWLSPPDPSKNHNIARKAHHEGSAEWFVRGKIFSEWKGTAGSLLWIRGKRVCLLPFIFVFMVETWFYSGVRKKRAFVRTVPFIPLLTADYFDQLNCY
jgi:hypothetical protein